MGDGTSDIFTMLLSYVLLRNYHCKPNQILRYIALDEWLATFMLSCLCLNFFLNTIMWFYLIGLSLSNFKMLDFYAVQG